MKKFISFLIVVTALVSCKNAVKNKNTETASDKNYISISRADYANKLYGFWLGECIANWTGLVTEMDKIGNVGEPKTGNLYTRNNWGKPDHPSI